MRILWAGGIASLAVLFVVAPVRATPWIDAEDMYLRMSIQTLADGGHLSGVVNTYPLMWSGISRDLQQIDHRLLSEDERFAFLRVRAALEYAQSGRETGLKLSGSSEKNSQYRSFGDYQRESGSLRVSRTFGTDFTAGRIRTSFRTGTEDQKDFVLDGSYLATTLGNWALSVDQMPVWWGPGQDNALVLSTNARPVQAIRINRLRDDSSDIPGLNLLGNWHATAFVGRTQRAGAVGDAKMSGARVTARPLSFIELGASYISQWDSDEYSGRYNEIAGVDARVRLPFNLGVYAEAASRNSEFDDLAWLGGVDLALNDNDQLRQVFLEWTDIPPKFYDDSVDAAGYRRWQQTIGSSHDQDVEGVTLGYSTQDANGRGWSAKIRWTEYGGSNLRMQREHLIQYGDDVERTQLDINYQIPLGNSLLNLGAQVNSDLISRNDMSNRKNRENNAIITLAWELRF
ncbi:capsule assembly Wzi family protein [Aliidiomarina sp. Khilg15.8]